jgi:O-antigen biosynthesis protein
VALSGMNSGSSVGDALERVGRIHFQPQRSPKVSVVIVGWRAAEHLLGCLRALAVNTTNVTYEVIVVLNSPIGDVVSEIEHRVGGVKLLRSRVNLGFGAACNWGVKEARGEFLAFLNDDAEPEPGWLGPLVETAEANSNIGAVGSRFINPDGTLQEAGSLLWSDGSTSAVGRGAPVAASAFDWSRRVDYCSAGSLLVRRSTWDDVGGFDEGYFPAYYEDVDLCLKIRSVGEQIWYQPRSVVRHLMSGSTSHLLREYLTLRNRQRLVERWAHLLSAYPPPDHDDEGAVNAAVWQAMGRPTRILLIDDRIPDPALGSGLARMLDTVTQLATVPQNFVTFLPSDSSDGDRAPLARLGVRLVTGDPADHLGEPGLDYDVVIMSRPHNHQRFFATVRQRFPRAKFVYDAEALYFRRVHRHAELVDHVGSRQRLIAEAQAMREIEAEICGTVDHVVCISEEEAQTVRVISTPKRVDVVDAKLSAPNVTERDYAGRRDLVMVAGWLAGAASPNGDGLIWFVRHVFPLVRARVPWARLRVTGAEPPPELLRFAGPSVKFEGRVEDLYDFYDQARVAVIPIRYGAGVKIKTLEALQYGVPTVSTLVGAEGIDLGASDALKITDDPREFAEEVVTLLEAPDVWAQRRESILRLHREWGRRPRTTTWPEIIAKALC